MKKLLSLAVLFALCSVAAADKDKERADALFKQGRKLMGEKRYADACQAFEESFKLDPGIGAEMNVGKCYQEWGKLARAYRAYMKAEELAKEQGDSRAGRIHELVEDIEKDVPKLTIKLPTGATTPDNLRVTIDGVVVDTQDFGKPQLVDPGPHLVEYQSEGVAKKNKVVPVERGGESSITLEVAPPVKKVDHDKEKQPPVEPPPVERPVPDPGRKQKLLAYGTAGAGGLLIVISSYMALSARSSYNDALSKDCNNMKDQCNPAGLTATHDARSEANIATILFLLGGAAVGGGVTLYLLAPHAAKSDEHALRITPEAHGDGAGLVLSGRW